MSLFSSVMRMASAAMGGSDAAVFPFTLGSELIAPHPSPHWRIFSATHSSTSEPHTVFSFEKARFDSSSLALARNALQKIKTLRYPHILRYVDSSDTATHLLIATEACSPFQHDFVRGDRKKEFAMALGLYSVTKAVSWMNNDCKLVHGALCPASIFTLKSGEYRLFGLDLAYKHADTVAAFNSSTLTPAQRAAFLPSFYRSPEMAKASSPAYFTTIEQDPTSPTPVHYLDAWALGVLIFDLHSNGTLSSPSQLANKDVIHPALQTEYKRLLSTNPVARINPSVVLASPFFTSNELVRCVNFLSELAIQSASDKDAFFSSFAKQVADFPEAINKYRVLPQLIDALSYGSGMSCFPSILTSVLKIGATLSPAEYSSTIIPAVSKLFSSNERVVRVHLLTHIEQFGPHLPADTVNESIFKHVLSGFHDSQPILREATMKSMPHFVGKLHAEHLQAALVQLAKMQTDHEPAIRTNTTYAIAKMAPNFNATTRDKVLANAFARALKDPFAPARVAGCVAFAATIDYHSAATCGRKIIPVVSPLTVDDAGEVREAALKAMSALVGKVTTFHQDGGVERPTLAAADGRKEGGVAGEAAASASALLANVSSWAVSSFASKFYGGGDIGSGGDPSAPPTPSKTMSAHPSFPSSSNPSAAPSSAPSPTAATNGTVSPPPSIADSAPVDINRDGWDEFSMDDFGAPSADEPDTAAVLSLSTKKEKKPSAGATRRAAKKDEKKSLAVQEEEDDDNDGFNDPQPVAAAAAAAAPSLDNWDTFSDALSTKPPSGVGGGSELSSFDPLSGASRVAAAPRKKAKVPLIAAPMGDGAAGVGAKKPAGGLQLKGSKGGEDDWASFLNSK